MVIELHDSKFTPNCKVELNNACIYEFARQATTQHKTKACSFGPCGGDHALLSRDTHGARAPRVNNTQDPTEPGVRALHDEDDAPIGSSL